MDRRTTQCYNSTKIEKEYIYSIYLIILIAVILNKWLMFAQSWLIFEEVHSEILKGDSVK